MSTYARVAFWSLPVMALLLWAALRHEPERPWVELAADGPWRSAALDDGRALHVLEPGQRRRVPPGTYRVTLVGADGGEALREVTVGEAGVLLGADR